jgi:multidrug efflux pump subunit AcrA (membrane-fusion protein)
MYNRIKLSMGKVCYILFSLTIAACSDSAEKQTAPSKANLQVEAFKVTPQPFENEVITTARLLPHEQTTIMAPVAGQVLDIYFKRVLCTFIRMIIFIFRMIIYIFI